jgi:hypothetical protein
LLLGCGTYPVSPFLLKLTFHDQPLDTESLLCPEFMFGKFGRGFLYQQLSLFKSRPRFLSPGTTRNQLVRVIDSLSSVFPSVRLVSYTTDKSLQTETEKYRVKTG